jgi:hypothetical protein
MQQQVKATRRKLPASAHVLLKGPEPLECYIRNATSSGARIQLMNKRAVLPHGFKLRMPGGRIETAELIWQNGASAGVRFLAPW